MDLTSTPCESTGPVRSERHLRLVPAPAALGGDADVPAEACEDETPSEQGLASVTYLTTFMPTEEEHDLAAPVAAVLPVPSL